MRRAVLAVLAVLACPLLMSACGSAQQTRAPTPTAGRAPVSATPASPSTRAAARRFLNRYVTGDGRVIRHDQGGDIVSEGQAYGMLIAEVAGKPDLARMIWSWTSAHLRTSDGLLASHATGSGQIEDPHSATDADILTAYALLRYGGPGQAALRADGRRLADAVLGQESVTMPGGAPLPVAGPWAKTTKPRIVNPSYLMPGVFAALAGLTGDDRWAGAADAAINLTSVLTNGATRLPPDWAGLEGERLIPIANPGGGAGAQYGFDASRLPIWFATACSDRARRLAAGWWRHILASDGRAGPQALNLDGTAINPAPSPLPLVAGAAAAGAAGDATVAHTLGTHAATLAREDPTYYGDAWVALGPALLEGSLNPCGEAGGRAGRGV